MIGETLGYILGEIFIAADKHAENKKNKEVHKKLIERMSPPDEQIQVLNKEADRLTSVSDTSIYEFVADNNDIIRSEAMRKSINEVLKNNEGSIYKGVVHFSHSKGDSVPKKYIIFAAKPHLESSDNTYEIKHDSGSCKNPCREYITVLLKDYEVNIPRMEIVTGVNLEYEKETKVNFKSTFKDELKKLGSDYERDKWERVHKRIAKDYFWVEFEKDDDGNYVEYDLSDPKRKAFLEEYLRLRYAERGKFKEMLEAYIEFAEAMAERDEEVYQRRLKLDMDFTSETNDNDSSKYNKQIDEMSKLQAALIKEEYEYLHYGIAPSYASPLYNRDSKDSKW